MQHANNVKKRKMPPRLSCGDHHCPGTMVCSVATVYASLARRGVPWTTVVARPSRAAWFLREWAALPQKTRAALLARFRAYHLQLADFTGAPPKKGSALCNSRFSGTWVEQMFRRDDAGMLRAVTFTPRSAAAAANKKKPSRQSRQLLCLPPPARRRSAGTRPPAAMLPLVFVARCLRGLQCFLPNLNAPRCVRAWIVSLAVARRSPINLNYATGIMMSALASGDVDLAAAMHWFLARKNKSASDDNCLKHALSGGHLACVRLVTKKMFAADSLAAAAAVKRFTLSVWCGTLPVTRYMCEKMGVSFTTSDANFYCARIAARGNLTCLRYAHRMGFPWNMDSVVFALAQGIGFAWDNADNSSKIDAILAFVQQHLQTPRQTLSTQTARIAARAGCLAILRWIQMISPGVDGRRASGLFDRHTAAAASESGHVHCLRFLHEAGCVWDTLTFEAAARRDQVDCMRYAIVHGCPFLSFKYFLTMAENYGARKCIEFLEKQLLLQEG